VIGCAHRPLSICLPRCPRSLHSRSLFSPRSWRSGLSDWAALSSLPELRAIFATAFDAPDEVSVAASAGHKKGAVGGRNQGAAGSAAARPQHKQPAAASASAASGSSAAAGGGAAAASAGPAAAPPAAVPIDPACCWFFLDKYRSQQGPVRADEIVRLYRLLQLNDASLVWCAAGSNGGDGSAAGSAAGSGASVSSGWVRLAEAPQFDGQIGPEVLEAELLSALPHQPKVGAAA